MQKVVFTSVKNEGPFLLEWIAYHRAIGFDKILVVSNDSDDGTTELLNHLAESDIIHHIYHEVQPKESPHGKAAALANTSGVLSDGDWTIWLDADEFLNIHVGDGLVDDLITSLGPAKGMLINWHTFGDSGHASFPGRFISKDFVGSDTRNFRRNRRVKTFFRWHKNLAKFMMNPHRPQLSNSPEYAISDFLNARGEPILANSDIHQEWVTGRRFTNAPSKIFMTPQEDYSWDIAQINHYTVRTRDVYDLKRHRGRSHPKLKSDGSPVAERHTDSFFMEFNRNEVEDRSILRFEDQVTQGLQELLQLPGVAAAQAETLSRTANRISELRKLEAAPDDAEPLPPEPPALAAPQIVTATAEAVPEPTTQPSPLEIEYLRRRISMMPWTRGRGLDPQQKALQDVLRVHAGAKIGNGCFISPDAHIYTNRLTLGERSWIAGGAVLRGTIAIGADSTVNALAQIAGKVSIGAGVRIAGGAAIFGFNHVFSRTDVPIHKQGITTEGIVIEDGAWIGANAVITDGCRIGRHTIVGAGAVVTKNFDDFLIVAGNPARIIRKRDESDTGQAD